MTTDGPSALRLDADDFALFGVPATYAQERAGLDTRWKALQAEVHPDRFAAQGAAAQRVAMQWAIRVNEAYQRLKDPLARAAYLCALKGQDVGAEHNTAMPEAFLMQQMAWRETLEAAHTLEEVEALADAVTRRRRALYDEIQAAIDVRQDWPVAAAKVRELMFITRFAQDVDRRLDTIG